MDRILGFDTHMLVMMGVTLFNILLFCFILYKVMYKSVQIFMENRTARVAKQIDDANLTTDEAQQLKELYEQKLIDIEVERDNILEAARRRANDKEERIIDEAKDEAEKIKTRAALDIERDLRKAQDDMRKEIIEISAMMSSRFVSQKMDELTQNKLLDEVIADLRDVKWQA